MNGTDRTVVHMVVLFIGLIALILAAGLLLLDYQGKTIDPLLATLAGGAVGSLATLLASTRGASTESPAGTPTDPVNVAPVASASAALDVHPDAPDSSDL